MKKISAAQGTTAVLCSITIMVALFFNSSMITNYTAVISQEMGVSRTAFSLYSTIRALAAVAVNLLLPVLLRKGSVKAWISAGIAASCINLLLLSHAHSLPAVYALALLGGAASALCGIPPVTLVLQNWFRRGFGTALSIAIASSGFGGMIFAPLLGAITAASSWRVGFRLIGVFCGLLSLLMVFFLRDAPAGSAPAAAPAGRQSARSHVPLSGSSVGSRDFRILLLVSAAFSLGPVAICTNVSSILQDIGFTSLFAAGTGYSIYAFSNSIGKVLMGRLSDRAGTGKMLLLWYGAVPVAMLYFMLCRTPSPVLAAPGLMLAGLSAGIYGVPLPITCRALYRDPAEQLYVISVCTSITNLALSVSYLIIHGFYDRTGSYMGAILFSLILASVCFLSIWLLCGLNREKLGLASGAGSAKEAAG